MIMNCETVSPRHIWGTAYKLGPPSRMVLCREVLTVGEALRSCHLLPDEYAEVRRLVLCCPNHAPLPEASAGTQLKPTTVTGYRFLVVKIWRRRPVCNAPLPPEIPGSFTSPPHPLWLPLGYRRLSRHRVYDYEGQCLTWLPATSTWPPLDSMPTGYRTHLTSILLTAFAVSFSRTM